MNKPQPPQHAPMDQFAREAGELIVGDYRLSDITALLGGTPYYVYDRRQILARIADLRSQLPADIKLHYAVKANPFPPVVQAISQACDGLDVASQREMWLALNSGMPAGQVSFAGPGKRPEELAAAVAAGVTLNVESAGELHQLLSLADEASQPPRIALRVNPAFELKSSGMKMTGGAKPFGIDAEQIPDLLTEIGRAPVAFRGLHIFSGSQNLNPEALIDAHNQTFALAAQLLADAPVAPHHVNIGGGFGIPYFPGEERLCLKAIGDNLSQLMQQYRPALSGAEIVIELGRYLVAEAGLYVTRVVDIKHSRGQCFAVCDGGLHHHLANSGNFGQVLRKNYPVALGTKGGEPASQTLSFVGPLCTPLDILAHQVTVPEVEIGDPLVIYQSGAYGASASPQAFLGHPEVREILL